eukprot:Gb_33881 [translate_table: standard]
MAFMAVLEADLRALSAEARRKYPAVKDGAEHAILKLRSLSDPSEIAQNDDILRIFLLACEVKTVKLSVIGLSCLQKLIAHDAVAPTALREILITLKEHAEMNDESVQLKTLQTLLIIFQSRLHPEDEENMAIGLGISLRLLENSRCVDSVHNTAAATLRQAVALIFDHVISAESLPVSKIGSNRHLSRTTSVSGDVSRSISTAKPLDSDIVFGIPSSSKESLTQAGKLGLRLFEDLTALAAGGSATWLRVTALQRTFALDILEFVLSNYVSVFRTLAPYEQVLRHQVCSLLMTSLRTTGELEGEVGEPAFRRLVLRSVAHVIRLYCSALVTECEVFLSMLVKITSLDLPLWHRIMVLEVLRGFCVEARVLRLLFQTFDMQPENTNVVSGMIKALAQVVTNVQIPDASEESLVAVAGMFSSKAKGVEWSMDNDATNASVVVASEAHAITLAVEGLLGVVFTVATLTDEAVDVGELDSPRCEDNPLPQRLGGELASLCFAMVNAVWRIILEALSLILSRSQGEAIVLEILKGYQAFTQACGVLRAVEPLNAFLASLCKFTLTSQNDSDRRSATGSLPSPGAKRTEHITDQRDSVILTPKNVQALRTLFNIAHRLDNVLGSSWVLVLETLAALDRIIHSPHATTQEVSAAVPRLTRETSGQSSDFNILSSLNSQLFESSALMNTSAVSSLLAALRQLSNDSLVGVASGVGQATAANASSVGSTVTGPMQQMTNKIFAVERMIAVLVNNLYRVELLWEQVIAHLLELAEHGSAQVRNVALDALDRSICAVLGSDHVQKESLTATSPGSKVHQEMKAVNNISDGKVSDTGREQHEFNSEPKSLECAVILPLRALYSNSQNAEVRAGSLKILLHVLERHGEKLYHSWPSILEMLRSVVNASEKDLIPLGFQSVRVIMNDGLLAVPAHCLEICIEVAGAYGAQRMDVNISLTAIGLLWTTSDFFARGVNYEHFETKEIGRRLSGVGAQATPKAREQKTGKYMRSGSASDVSTESSEKTSSMVFELDCDKLLLSVFGVLQNLGTDERPEVRNSAIRTLFQSLSSHGHKLSKEMWEHCLWKFVFPLLNSVRHLAATSSKDEWQGKELGMRGGKPVHMLVHHSRNTAQKQWDETLVLVLGGMSRLLRPFFLFLQTLNNFQKGWDSLLFFIQESILNGSKEVALAAINCLQTVLLAHCSKGNMPLDFFKSGFLIYETVLKNAADYNSRVTSKAKQELLRSLGELYVQANSMFDSSLYLRVLALVDLMARNPKNIVDGTAMDYGSIPPVHRAVLEAFSLLKPKGEQHSCMWPSFLRQILSYLPGDESYFTDGCASLDVFNTTRERQQKESSITNSGTAETLSIHGNEQNLLTSQVQKSADIKVGTKETLPSGNSDFSNSVHKDSLTKAKFPVSDLNAAHTKDMSTEVSSTLFAEKIVTLLVDLFLLAPSVEKMETSPEVIAALGRCMATRRDIPASSLWRTAVEAFNRILIDDLSCLQSVLLSSGAELALHSSGLGRPRFWKEVADAYETFLVGSCGRAFPSEFLSSATLRADESLEANVLDVLCNSVLKSCIDAPVEALQRLVSTLDRCAARTSSLPIESVGLLPAHCSRFSLTCLQKIFSLCSYEVGTLWDASRLTISRIALPILTNRCDFILRQFLTDENDYGDTPLPSVRVDELIYVLQELARLLLHSNTASILDLPLVVKRGVLDKDRKVERAHLLILFPSLCELVICREARVRELVQVLLRLVSTELGLGKGLSS